MHAVSIKSACQRIRAEFKAVVAKLVTSLRTRGYADKTISFYEEVAVHFSFWLTKRRIGPCQLKDCHIAEFLSRHLPKCGCPVVGVRQRNTVRAGLVHFAAILRDAGYMEQPKAAAEGIDLEMQSFDDYMLKIVGLQQATRLYRRRYVREFLRHFFPDGCVRPSRLTPKGVVSYLSKRGAGMKTGSTKVVASSLRSYFRFRRLSGGCDESLALAVPAFASWRSASLPTVLADEQVERLLSAFDLETVAGRRDYAITRCLVDLGLRAQEAARLRLDDIDWRRSVVRIAETKSRRDDELPLTSAVGAALAAYIRRGRPNTTAREVFLLLRAPVGQRVTRATITGVVVRAAYRAGLASITGSRILRHSAATRMLRHGTSIKEIADVLRHKCLDTTAIYMKIDLPHLAAVALPWPAKAGL